MMKDKDKLLYSIEILESLLLLLESSRITVGIDHESEIESFRYEGDYVSFNSRSNNAQIKIDSSPRIIEELVSSLYRNHPLNDVEPNFEDIYNSINYLKGLWTDLFDRETYEKKLEYARIAKELEESQEEQLKIMSEEEFRKKEEEFFKQIVKSKKKSEDSENPFDDIIPIEERDKVRARKEALNKIQGNIKEIQESTIERLKNSRDLLI